jgi:D-alanyl-lipoteichoic acid acyltransferase DltB (MBOAT superfamily)
MSFNSLAFLFIFLPVVVAGYFLLGRGANRNWPKIWLLAASLAFYSGGRIGDLPVLLASVVVNCLIAKRLLKPGGRRGALLAAGIAANVLFLCYFKYAGFFFGTSNAAHVWFPLGISFFTIQQIMFLVDCYEGLIEGHNWLDYLVFAGFFPYVTMGPIVRWKQVAPQLNDAKGWRFNPDNVATGLYVLAIGLFKKVVLADSFFRWADAGFSYGQPLSLVGGWITALAFAFQLYFDFSGYTDMAIGAALMLNINLPQNFNAPFRAQSITDFWRRWHMTLTNFFTTYLYTPMIRTMKKATIGKAMLATFVTMLIIGFWHGPNWTFVIFGALHGVALAVNQYWRKKKWPMPGPLGWLLTFTFVVVALVFFRAASVTQATEIIASMFSLRGGVFNYEPWSGIGRVDQLLGIGWMLFGVAIQMRGKSSLELQRTFKPSWATVAVAVGLAAVSCIYVNGVVSRSFVYRDF